MQKLVQAVRDGTLELREAPRPQAGPTEVLVETRASLISSGTERHVRRLASASLLAKARARPDLVRQVIRRARTAGIADTLRAVQTRLAEDMELGYSAAGVVAAVGEAVSGVRPGDRVATAGAGHADLQVVAGNLTARLPSDVTFEDGAFTTVAAIALNGLRLAGVGPGDRVVVVGLGLVGQLVARLAGAAGADVAGLDFDGWKLDMARQHGVESHAADDEGWEAVAKWTSGRGADAVLVAASTDSSDPMLRAAGAARDRGTIVLVGDVGLDLDRRPLYDKELTVKVARSYGPGRYDPSYEDLGVDYPYGHVRWTAQRNMEAVLALVASERLAVADLVSHRVPFTEAVGAYDLLEEPEARALGVLLTYAAGAGSAEPLRLPARDPQPPAATGRRTGLVGAGRFAATVLLPAAQEAGLGPWTGIASAGGSSAARLGAEWGFQEVHPDPAGVIGDDGTDVVIVATRHDTHAELTAAALAAGKHVFCEKPLALSADELGTVVDAWAGSRMALVAGFNRRWSPAVTAIVDHFGAGGGPLQVHYGVNAGELPPDHWLHDRRQGGRLLGEACHFIDTATAIVGERPASAYTASAAAGPALLAEEFTIVLGYPGGSQATIAYTASGPVSGDKERLRVVGRQRAATLFDFRRLELEGPGGARRIRYRDQDKGHGHQLRVFAAAVDGNVDRAALAEAAFMTSHATLAAVESLLTGVPVALSYEYTPPGGQEPAA